MKKFFWAVALMTAVCGLSSCGGGSNVPTVECKDTVISAFNYPEGSPVAVHGALQVNGVQLCDKNGEPIQLAGVSTMGWQWCGDCYTRESFEHLRDEWKINVLRLAMYVEEGGYNTTPDSTRKQMCDFIDMCGELGIYCIVDWHVLNPGDPTDPRYSGADDFFRFISSKYAGADHVLYEICNEPNNCLEKENKDRPWECTKEGSVTWDVIKGYADRIIPIIHSAADSAQAQHPIVIVGTPQWDQLVDACLKVGMCQGNGKDLCDKYEERDARLKFDNVMYAFHFYALEHKEEVDDKPGYYNFYSYIYDVLAKLPVFCSEYGVTYADGDRGMDLERTDKWLMMFQGNNAGKQIVSHCNWSFSDNHRLSSALKVGSCAKQEWDSTTVSGEYIKKVIRKINGGIEDTTVLKPSNIYVK